MRGSQLLIASYNHGVTSVRALVEVDTVTGTQTLEQAVLLKQLFAGRVAVHICAFAQDLLFLAGCKANLQVLLAALDSFADHNNVLSTTPRREEPGLGRADSGPA